jgi:hypothetical protein
MMFGISLVAVRILLVLFQSRLELEGERTIREVANMPLTRICMLGHSGGACECTVGTKQGVPINMSQVKTQCI